MAKLLLSEHITQNASRGHKKIVTEIGTISSLRMKLAFGQGFRSKRLCMGIQRFKNCKNSCLGLLGCFDKRGFGSLFLFTGNLNAKKRVEIDRKALLKSVKQWFGESTTE